MPLIIRALLQIFNNWRSILALTGLILATGFSLKMFIHEAGESVSKFWWVAGLACLVILGREYIKVYFDLKKEQLRQNKKQ